MIRNQRQQRVYTGKLFLRLRSHNSSRTHFAKIRICAWGGGSKSNGQNDDELIKKLSKLRWNFSRSVTPPSEEQIRRGINFTHTHTLDVSTGIRAVRRARYSNGGANNKLETPAHTPQRLVVVFCFFEIYWSRPRCVCVCVHCAVTAVTIHKSAQSDRRRRVFCSDNTTNTCARPLRYHSTREFHSAVAVVILLDSYRIDESIGRDERSTMNEGQPFVYNTRPCDF